QLSGNLGTLPVSKSSGSESGVGPLKRPAGLFGLSTEVASSLDAWAASADLRKIQKDDSATQIQRQSAYDQLNRGLAGKNVQFFGRVGEVQDDRHRITIMLYEFGSAPSDEGEEYPGGPPAF